MAKRLRTWQNRARKNRPRLPSVIGPYELLSADPVVLYAADPAFNEPDLPVFSILDAAADRPVHVLLAPWWYVGPRFKARLVETQHELRVRYPRLSLIMTAPTELDRATFAAAGLNAVHVNQNAFVDETRYTIGDVEKRYDALYTARLAPFKRLELAQAIDRLALICVATPKMLASPYGRRIRSRLRHAAWLLQDRGMGGGAGPTEVAGMMQQCRVGLALSAEEGPMYASIEYLLAGLPVVTTPSRGGRHEFFDPAFVRVVDASPAAVARGVRELIDARLDPGEIREKTLRKMYEHRRRFIGVVQQIFDDAGAGRRFAEEWETVFYDKLLPWGVQGRDAIGARNRSMIERLESSGLWRRCLPNGTPTRLTDMKRSTPTSAICS